MSKMVQSLEKESNVTLIQIIHLCLSFLTCLKLKKN